MAFTVTMPQLGETVTEGTILRWAKQPGDHVSEDEVLLEISTDKVDTEMPSPAAGTLQEILVAEGQTVAVGTPLAVIGEGAAAPEPAPETPAPQAAAPAPGAAAQAPAAAPPAPVPSPPPPAPVSPAPMPAPAPAPAAAAPGGDGMRGVLSPVVRRLVRESGIDVSQVPGTGEGGRVTRRDVESFIASGRPATAPPPAAVPAPPAAVPASPRVAPPAPVEPVPAAVLPAAASEAAGLEGIPLLEGDEVVQLSRLRSRIAQNMLKAKQTAAHVWTTVEVDFENVERVRARHRDDWKRREGSSLTYLAFIARATVDALNQFPVVNSSIYPEQGKAVYHRAINLGIAVDINQEGLVVGTLRGADSLRVVGLARGIRVIAAKARDGKLEPDDVSGSTFTITNPGPFGSTMSAPIINVPNTGILSTDTVVKRPVVVTDLDGNDAIAIRHIGFLSLTWDHRAFDGSAAVLFLRRIKENLETWDWEQELA